MYQETFQTRDLSLAATLVCYGHKASIEVIDYLGRASFSFPEDDQLETRIQLWNIGSENLKVDPKKYSYAVKDLKMMIEDFRKKDAGII